MKRFPAVSALMAALAIASSLALADEPKQTQDQTRTQARDQDQIYGSQLMTPEERAQFRERMRAAKTEDERERIRREHHAQMQQRAKERGVTLPDEPPPRGHMRERGGMGPGGGMGGGMGPGR